MNKEITKKDLRENYIITLAITLASLGRLGRFFYDNPKVKMDTYLKELKNIDWLRSNPEWLGRTIRSNGKVLNSEEAIALTCTKIKQLIGLDLTDEEKQKENQFMEKK